MIAQRIVAIALGYEDLNDHQTLGATRPSNWPPVASLTASSPGFAPDPLPPGEPDPPHRP